MTVLGLRSREGDDADLILLAGSHQDTGVTHEGLYLFHSDSAYFYPFPTTPDPARDYIFRLDFESSEGDIRKLWAMFTVDSQRRRSLQVHSHWSGNDHVLRLIGQEVSDGQARQNLAAELVPHIRAMRATWDSQQALAASRGVPGPVRSQGEFLARLELCTKIEETSVHTAVLQERAKFGRPQVSEPRKPAPSPTPSPLISASPLPAPSSAPHR